MLENRTKSFKNCTEIASKKDKASTFLTIQCQFEAFCFTNWAYLLKKAHQNNKVAHALGVLTFQSTNSINILAEFEQK